MSDLLFWKNHFLGATILAKAIYLLLAFLSISAWAIIIGKFRVLRQRRKGTHAFRELYRKGRHNPIALYRHILANRNSYVSPLTTIFLMGCEELQNQLDRGVLPGGGEGEAKSQKITPHQMDLIGRSLDTVQDSYFLNLEHLLIHLATTISVAPFLGLLGTVWGILVAFQDMGQQGSTGMTAFGPGLSEALISTVSGLVVAIPALLGYNFIGSQIGELAGEASHFTADFLALIEKEFVQQ